MKKPIRNSKSNPKPIARASPSGGDPRGEHPGVAAPGTLPPASSLLTSKELGGRFGKSQFTVYRWIDEGLIPERFVHYRGKREILINVEAVEHLRTAFRAMHD